MGAFDDVERVPRRTMVLFFLIDTSSSMKGDKIKSLNKAINDIIPYLTELSTSNVDAEVKVAVLDFSSGVEWMYPEPVGVENFKWRDLKADGITDLGEACIQLNEKLSRKAFMYSESGSFAPIIVLFSDGEPTDNYKKGIELLNGNNWFRAGIKIAIAIGDDADKQVLAEFAGNKECVLTVHNSHQIRSIMQFVSVATGIASRSTSVGQDAAESKNEEVLKKIREAQVTNELSGIDIGVDAPPSGKDDWGGW